MTKSEKELREFLLDIDCLKELDKWTDDFNLFNILKIANMEIKHSNILAWLFDPNENHSIGDAFIEGFFRRLVEKLNENDASINYFDLLIQNFYSYQVYREVNNMDIVLFSEEEKTAVIIENKVWADESKHQLKKYVAKSKEEYKECKYILYVFLTPDGHSSSDPDNWISFSYGEIIRILECAKKVQSLREEVDLIIKNYIEMVRKNIMNEKDKELISVCNAIYNKHRSALRLIFETVGCYDSRFSEILVKTLKELSDAGHIIYDENYKAKIFKTKAMNDLFTTYEYAFKKIKGKETGTYQLKLFLYIDCTNLNDEQSRISKALIKAAGKKTDVNETKILYSSTVKIVQDSDDYESDLENTIKKLVESALENEKKLLEKTKELLETTEEIS